MPRGTMQQARRRRVTVAYLSLDLGAGSRQVQPRQLSQKDDDGDAVLPRSLRHTLATALSTNITDKAAAAAAK